MTRRRPRRPRNTQRNLYRNTMAQHPAQPAAQQGSIRAKETLLFIVLGEATPGNRKGPTKGKDVELTITDGIVRGVRGADAPMTGLAVQARTIANFLPLLCSRAGVTIVHNSDRNYTGIRFETKAAGPVVLEIPTGEEPYRLVQEFIDPDESGRMEVELRRFPQIYKPHGIAHITAEFLRSNGFLK